jgi:hypothetical protein
MDRFATMNISCITERRVEMQKREGDFIVKPEQALVCMLKVGAV